MPAFIIFFIVIAILIQQNSRKGDLSGLDARLSSTASVIEPGQDFEFVMDLTNRKFRFYPFLKLRLYVPEGIEFPKLKKGVINKSSSGGFEVILTTWMMPRQKLRLTIPAVINRRGRYFTNGINISVGDFMGMNEMASRYDDFVEIVCLPKETDSKTALNIAGGFPGELSVNRFIFEDPVLTIGYREYTGREPMKQISWLRSAQSGQLIVKEMDHTLESSVTVVLNLETDTDDKYENMEKAFSMARYVCRKLEDDHMTYSFTHNAISAGSVKGFRFVGEGLGRTHFGYILEGLGRCDYQLTKSNKELLDEAVKRSSGSYGIVYITAGDDMGQCEQAKRAASRSGLQIMCINAGGII